MNRNKDNQTQRQKKLMNMLRTQGILPIKSLAVMFDVSEMTIRRDLRAIEAQTASGSHPNGSEYNLLTAIQKSDEQKKEIGQKAAELVQPNDVIIIDTGSTVVKMVPYLPEDYNLTIVCYNANVFFSLRYKPGITIMFCGGVYHSNTEMCESPNGIQYIRSLRANKAFLSAAGVHKDMGITCANVYEVPTKQAVMQSSMEKILVVDSSKFGQVRSSYFCELDDINKIVTDKMILDDWSSYLEEKGIDVYF